MHHCMTLTLSNTVFENCDSILVLFTDYISLDINDVRYIIEVLPLTPKTCLIFSMVRQKLVLEVA
jgi:hypothetical protein